MLKLFNRAGFWRLVLTIAIGLSICGSQLAQATNYGANDYGDCGYQSCASSTKVTLPTGLEVDINLHDGQEIPQAGYTIIVTPLNGQGSSFKQVDIYIEGVLVATVTPAENGTAQWFWDPSQFPGTDVKIIVTGVDGQTVTKEFHVTIAKAATSSTANTNKPTPSLLEQIAAVPGNLIRGTQELVHKLPPVVKHSLPYFLFLILAADLLLMILQFRRELDESRTLRAILIRECEGGQLKKMLVDLMSHYLRTPITIIAGAIDLGSVNGYSPAVVANLRQAVAELNTKVKTLIAQAQFTGSGENARLARIEPTPKLRPLWRQPFLVLPALAVGVVAFTFDYLAGHNSDFTLNQTNIVIQLVVFGSLVATLYLVIRQLELSRRDIVKTKRLLQDEVDFNHRRDELIDLTGLELSGSMGDLDRAVSGLPAAEATAVIKAGLQQFHDVVQKCVVARQLKGTTSTEPPVTTRLSSLSVLTGLQEQKAQAKGIKIVITHDSALVVRSAGLLAFVVGTVLDNAIEYSPPQGEITVAARQNQTLLNIAVTDHGPGIPEDKRFALFQAFSKAEGTEVFDHKGAGFSLYLDKLIMSYLLGDIAIESASPQGTTVTLRLATGATA